MKTGKFLHWLPLSCEKLKNDVIPSGGEQKASVSFSPKCYIAVISSHAIIEEELEFDLFSSQKKHLKDFRNLAADAFL